MCCEGVGGGGGVGSGGRRDDIEQSEGEKEPVCKQQRGKGMGGCGGGGGGGQYPDDRVQRESEKVCNCTGGKGGTRGVMVPCSVKVSRKSATAPEVTGGGGVGVEAHNTCKLLQLGER